jgi:hypothetical protein
MIIEMTKDAAGIWKYHDQQQAELCLFVHVLTGKEITWLDDWLNTDSHWTDDEALRAELVRLRHQLTASFKKYRHDNYVIKVEAERLFATADRTTLLVAGYKRSDQIRSAARMPRRKDAFKAALSQAMHSRKAEMMPFKEFMQAWTLGHINGFTATTTPDAKAYMVRDENGDLGERRYTWGTLERMFSES